MVSWTYQWQPPLLCSFLQSVSSPLQSLQQRTWLIHWSLFVFFNHPKGRDNIIELFLYQPQWVFVLSPFCCNLCLAIEHFYFGAKQLRISCKHHVLRFQVPECHPNNVPTHPKIPHYCSHHQQRRAEAQASAEGLGEGHSAGKAANCLQNNSDSETRWMTCFLLCSAAGVVHVQRPNHRVRGVPLRQLWLRQRPEEAEGVWIGEHSFPLCLRDSVRLSRCTDLNRPTKVSHLLGPRADGKLLLATGLWSPESLAFNFAAIQPQQIHVWPDLLAFNFIRFDLQSGTAVRFRAWLPSL